MRTDQKKLPILWRRGALWLAFLGPFFFITYGTMNAYTASRTDVSVIVQTWERALPFVPWLMLPYMSIDAFYAASLFTFRKRNALDRHALRLLLATVISLLGFWLFPLQFSFAVPKADGFNGVLQAVLLGFDKPFNQAPSLHISLLLVLWVVYAKLLRGAWRWLLHVWFFAIAASVLLVYQHHFVDVWTGALAGVACLYFVPDRPFFWRRTKPTARMQALAWRYGLGALAALLAVYFLGATGGRLLLLWLAMALSLVAAAYLGFEQHVFQRHKGHMRWPARVMLAPYLMGSFISYYFRVRKRKLPDQIHAHVWLGAFPNKAISRMDWGAALDLSPEFIKTHLQQTPHYQFLPMLDLVPPRPKQLVKAVRWLQRAQTQHNRVLVHCTLGVSRSASVVACWLVWQNHAADIAQAITHINQARSGIVITPEHEKNIGEALNMLRSF